jgi:ABC-type amino acid transport substrate-binding protein
VKKILIWLLIFCFSCSVKSAPFSIAIDKNWYSIALNGQEASLNGFITDLLLELAKENKIEISLINANWDNILDGLNSNKYQAVFSALQPYNFNESRYDFSKAIIKTGYVLVAGIKDKYKNLEDMKEKHVGYIRSSDSLVIIQKYVNIFDEVYDNAAMMLGDITKTKIDGAVLSVIPAYRYVSDLFYNELKIVYPPINDQAIRLLTLKDKNKKFMKLFNNTLEKFKKNGKLKELKSKWKLPD